MARFVPKSRKRRNSRYKPSYRSSRQNWLAATSIYTGLILCAGTWIMLFTQGHLTIGGVPSPIIIAFLQDDTARSAYFAGDSKKLHDRLQTMGVEERIKAFYRPQFTGDELQLDQYIHQILYDRTGYVGASYQLSPQGNLVLKQQR